MNRAERRARRARAAVKGVDRADAAIERQAIENRGRCRSGKARRRRESVQPRLGFWRLVEKRGELAVDAWANRPGSVLLGLEERGRDDHIGIDGPERHPHDVRDRRAPAFGLPQRILVANHQRRPHFFEKRRQPMMGMRAEDERSAPRRDPRGEIGEPLGEEGVVTQVGSFDERVQPEEDDERLAQQVGGDDGDVERRVVDRALRPLHPVDHRVAVGIRGAAPPDRDARV